MDLEDYLSLTYTPLKAIEVLNRYIYENCNEKWDMFAGNENRKGAEELLAINFAVKLCVKHLLEFRHENLYNS